MDPSANAKTYADSIKGDAIDSAILTKLPELVTCSDWTKVDIVGRVDYISDRARVHYDGILVKYKGGLYYIKKGVVTALGNIDSRFKKAPKTIKVN